MSVDIEGDRVVVGAAHDNDLGARSGSAYLFVRNGTTWNQQAKILASDGAAEDVLGVSVALSARGVVVGAVFDDDWGDRLGFGVRARIR